MKKPFKGAFDNWEIKTFGRHRYVTGKFVDHPEFHGKSGHSSNIVRKYEENGMDYVETRNSIYRLLNKKEEDTCSEQSLAV